MFQSQSVIKGSQGRNSGQEPESRNWNRDHRILLLLALLFMACSVCFLCTAVDHLPGVGTANSGLGCLTLIINQENVLQGCHRPVLWRHFLSWESLFPHDSSLCLIDRKKRKKNLGSKIDFLSTWHISSSLSNYNFPFLFISKISY